MLLLELEELVVALTAVVDGRGLAAAARARREDVVDPDAVLRDHLVEPRRQAVADDDDVRYVECQRLRHVLGRRADAVLELLRDDEPVIHLLGGARARVVEHGHLHRVAVVLDDQVHVLGLPVERQHRVGPEAVHEQVHERGLALAAEEADEEVDRAVVGLVREHVHELLLPLEGLALERREPRFVRELEHALDAAVHPRKLVAVELDQLHADLVLAQRRHLLAEAGERVRDPDDVLALALLELDLLAEVAGQVLDAGRLEPDGVHAVVVELCELLERHPRVRLFHVLEDRVDVAREVDEDLFVVGQPQALDHGRPAVVGLRPDEDLVVDEAGRRELELAVRADVPLGCPAVDRVRDRVQVAHDEVVGLGHGHSQNPVAALEAGVGNLMLVLKLGRTPIRGRRRTPPSTHSYSPFSPVIGLSMR